jgi:hypothetical protein
MQDSAPASVMPRSVTIRATLVSVTLEDCIRMHERLENLFVAAQKPSAAQHGPGRLSRRSPFWPQPTNLAFVQIEKIFL